MVESTDKAIGLLDLASMVAEGCGSETKKILWSKFLLIADGLLLGEEGVRYELDRALKSIRFFELAELCRPEISPNGRGTVSEVEFTLTL